MVDYSPQSAPAMMHSDVMLISSPAEPAAADHLDSVPVPARKRFKHEMNKEMPDELITRPVFSHAEDSNCLQHDDRPNLYRNSSSGVGRINRNRALYGIPPGLKPKAETLKNGSELIEPVSEQSCCDQPAQNHLLTDIDAVQGEHAGRDEPDTDLNTCDSRSLQTGQIGDPARNDSNLDCHHESTNGSQFIEQSDSKSVIITSEIQCLSPIRSGSNSECHRELTDGSQIIEQSESNSVVILSEIDCLSSIKSDSNSEYHRESADGSQTIQQSKTNFLFLKPNTNCQSEAPGRACYNYQDEDCAQDIKVPSSEMDSQVPDTSAIALPTNDEVPCKVRIPSVCLMPCRCERCFFGHEDAILSQPWRLRRGSINKPSFRFPHRSSGFRRNSRDFEGAFVYESETDNGRLQDQSSNSVNQFRNSHNRRGPFSKPFNWATNNEHRLSDSWKSPSQIVNKTFEVPWSNQPSNDPESLGAGDSNCTMPSVGTEVSGNCPEAPAKRQLSAAEKEAILAKTKFQIRAPVLGATAIPRLDEGQRPRRPLVRPVFSSPSTRINIRPARLVAYRSDSRPPKSDSVDAEDESSPSVNDEIPVVSEEVISEETINEELVNEELVNEELVAADTVIEKRIVGDETVPVIQFRYIRYAKGKIGVQLLSFPSNCSNIIHRGLYCDLAHHHGDSLPLREGADMLNDQSEFKLPFSMVHSRLAELELDELRKTGTFTTSPPPFFLINRNIRPATTILPEYAGGDEILDCECPAEIEPGCGPGCINRLTHVECEPDQCKLGDRCTNQRFQRRQWAKLTVEFMGEKGWGLVLAQDVRQGDLIIEYVGELLDLEACKDRCRNEYRGEKHFYLLSLYNNIVIDATRRGNIGRFCNHSCEPSCDTQKWSVRGSPRIGIFALRDLPKGTEVTIDYNFERVGLAMTKCLCGTVSCRGFLGASKTKKRKDQICFDFDYDIARDGPLILDTEQQVTQLSEYLNRDRLPDSFLSMVAEIGPSSTEPALLLRNVVRVHSAFMDRLEYNPCHP